MQSYEDPRNMFYNQRQQYEEQTTKNTANSQTGDTSRQNTKSAKTTQGQNGTTQADYEKKLEEMKKLAAKYEREGEGQLVKDIVNNVLEQKAAGNLSNEQLVAFAKRVSPLLNSEQRSRLNGLVEQLLKL